MTHEQIDQKIDEYETAIADEAILTKRVKDLKAKIVTLVETSGTVPANAKSMKRLSGLKKSASLSYSSTITVKEDGVSKLQTFLESKGLGSFFGKFFELQTPPVYVPPPPAHRRLKTPDVVLEDLPKEVKTPTRIKIFALYAMCLSSKPNNPSLKIEAAK